MKTINLAPILIERIFAIKIALNEIDLISSPQFSMLRMSRKIYLILTSVVNCQRHCRCVSIVAQIINTERASIFSIERKRYERDRNYNNFSPQLPFHIYSFQSWETGSTPPGNNEKNSSGKDRTANNVTTRFRTQFAHTISARAYFFF